jgi:hypothetical protein
MDTDAKQRNHLYHERCLRQWFDKKLDCPLCRGTDLLTTHVPESQNNLHREELKDEGGCSEEKVTDVSPSKHFVSGPKENSHAATARIQPSLELNYIVEPVTNVIEDTVDFKGFAR